MDITPTEEWQAEIEHALFEMDSLVAVFALGFQGSAWTDQEIGVAIGRGVPVLNLSLGEPPHGFVAKRQAIPAAHRSSTDVAADVANALLRNSTSLARFGEALAAAFSASRGYDEARQRLALLERAAPLSPQAIDEAVRGFRANGECRHSSGVRERLQSLIPFEVDLDQRLE